MEQVLKYIDEHQDDYIELLKRFCAQPSVAAQNLGMRDMARLVQETLNHQLGAYVELVETDGFPVVYATIDAHRPLTLTFYNHYDVQPPEPYELWESDPFTPTIRDGKIFARGVADNKGSLLSRVCAVDAFSKTSTPLPINIKFIVEGEEEIGSPHLGQFRVNHPDKVKTDAIIWEGGSKDINRGPLQITLGWKGLVYLELHCKTASSDLHSMYGSIIPNAAWRLIHALKTMKNDEGDITIDGFMDDVATPTEQEMDFLNRINFDEESIKESFGIDQYIGADTGKALKKRFLYAPSCNIAGFLAGYTGEGAKTVLPARAMCKIDFRLVRGQTVGRVIKQVEDHLKKRGFDDIEVIHFEGKDPYHTDADAAIVRASIDCAEEIYGMPPSIYRNGAGTTAMGSFCGPENIPAVCFGIDHVESHIHAPNENIYLDDFINGIKMTALVMKKYADYMSKK